LPLRSGGFECRRRFGRGREVVEGSTTFRELEDGLEIGGVSVVFIVVAVLALTAENIQDDEKRDKLLDAVLTIPPLTEWPADCRQKLWDTCQFIKSLAEGLRQRGELRDGSGI
jgi:hypothetical protein